MFYPLDLKQKNDNVNAFINALFEEISKETNASFLLVNVNTLSLLQGLEENRFDAVVTASDPGIILKDKYHFSKPLLELGPVLVVRSNSSIKSLKDIENAVAISPYNDSVYIVQKYPSILMHYYENMSFALEDVANGKIEAALVDNLEAYSLVPTVYAGRLSVVTSPLNQKAIRVIALKDKNPDLISDVDRSMEVFKKNNTLKNLYCLFGVN